MSKMSLNIKFSTSNIFQDSLYNYLKTAETNTRSVSEVLKFNAAANDDYDEPEMDYDNKYFYALKKVAGLWGTHRVQDFQWTHRSDKNFPKILNFEDFVLDERESAGILSDRIIGSNLSHLERCPEVDEFAFTKCILVNLQLVDISALEKFCFIQYLDLSDNQLRSLEALSQLPFLQYLEASDNQLENLLDFNAPFYLSFVNCSNNLISEIPDLSDFWSITHLYLANNKITKIDGLQNLKFLSHLDLSENEIQLIENLDNLRIQTLHLQKNLIRDGKDASVLSSLEYLITLDLSDNKLTSLEIFKHVQKIENLNVNNNSISNLLEITNLADKRYLQRLDLSNNPVIDLKYYTEVCIRTIGSLRELDGEQLSAEKRVLARTMSQLDHLEARQTRTELLLLEQINHPKIGNHVFPWDQPPPKIIAFVGLPACKHTEIAMNFVDKYSDKLVLGVSHTTRPRREQEVDAREYYFISKNEFRECIRQGDFITVSEFNGHRYGISHRELEKAIDKIIVFHCDINTALNLKLIGLSPILFLTLPKNEQTHMYWVSKAYTVNQMYEIVFSYENAEAQVGQESSRSGEGTIDKSVMSYEHDSDFCKTSSLESIDEPFDLHQMSILKKNESKERAGSKKVSFTRLPSTSTKSNLYSTSESTTDDPLSTNSCGKFTNSSDKPLYMSTIEIPGRSASELMQNFFLSILNQRNNLLELHWENPGLFRDVIHPDELENSMLKLKTFLKTLIETSGSPQQLFFCFEHDPAYKDMLQAKLKCFDVEKNMYYKKSNNL